MPNTTKRAAPGPAAVRSLVERLRDRNGDERGAIMLTSEERDEVVSAIESITRQRNDAESELKVFRDELREALGERHRVSKRQQAGKRRG